VKNPFRFAIAICALTAIAALAHFDVMAMDQAVWFSLATVATMFMPATILPSGWAAADTNAPIAEVQKAVKEILEGFSKHQKAVQDTLAEHEKQLKETGKVSDTVKTTLEELNKKGAEQHGRLNDIEQKLARDVESLIKAKNGATSPGDLIIADKDFQAWAKAREDGGSAVAPQFKFRTKNITSLGASGGPGIYSDQLPGVIENPLRPMTIRDLVMPGRTVSNLLEWIQELSYTNNADVVTEGTLKPQSELTYERKNTGVSTIAHWIRATKQVLADFPQLASLINGRLRWGLKIKEEDQLLYGDGTGENLLGLIPQATAYNTALNTPNDTMIDIIRHAMLQVRLSFYPSTGHVLSPTDWHYLELTKDNENRYIMASPTSRTPPMLWGLPVVESDAMHQGNFLEGSFRMAAQIFDREEASILVSTEDQDNFVKNLVTILCEERLALLVYRPLAFVFGAFPAGSTT
jgi:HK97 family phage major capsid protein